MKKAFSLMEVLIAVTILSIVMISLLQIKSDNIFLVSKVDEKVKFNDYILLSIDLDKAESRNQNIFLDRKYDFSDDEIRRELKTIKVKQKDKKIKTQKIKDVDDFNLNIITYATSYSLDDKIKKNIYTFKLEL